MTRQRKHIRRSKKGKLFWAGRGLLKPETKPKETKTTIETGLLFEPLPNPIVKKINPYLKIEKSKKY